MRFKHVILALHLTAFNWLSLSAQSLIVGIPNADVTHKGHIAITHESQTDFWDPNPGWNSFNFITYGLSKKVELAVSVNNVASPASGNIALGSGFKFVQQLFEKSERLKKWEFKITAGAMLLNSLERRMYTAEATPEERGNRIGYWVYGHSSMRIPKLQTRFTGGLSYGTGQAFGIGNTPLVFMGGVEQPLTKRWAVIADWYSGNHALAAAIPAVQYNLNKPRGAAIVGVKLPNNPGEQRTAAIFEVMLEF